MRCLVGSEGVDGRGGFRARAPRTQDHLDSSNCGRRSADARTGIRARPRSHSLERT